MFEIFFCTCFVEDLQPYLFRVPHELCSYSALLKFIGVAESPSPVDLINILHVIQKKMGNNPITPHQVTLTLEITSFKFKLNSRV